MYSEREIKSHGVNGQSYYAHNSVDYTIPWSASFIISTSSTSSPLIFEQLSLIKASVQILGTNFSTFKYRFNHNTYLT